MPFPELERALAMPAGARFFRCALQVNPHDYLAKHQGGASSPDAADYARAMIAKAVDLGIEVLAITDHNDVSGADLFAREAEGSGVTILPGFEVCTAEGVHVLGIFDAGTPHEHVRHVLSRLDVKPGSDTTVHCDKPFSGVVAVIEGQQGIAVAAHVNDDSGLLRLSAGPRLRAWTTPAVAFAAAITKPLPELDQAHRDILLNKDVAHRRSPPHDKIAIVYANDVKRPEDLASSRATTFIKMSRPSISGLKQAFLDPGSRIRLNPPATGDRHPYVEAIAWSSGSFMGDAALRLNDGLDVLVGGRGSGKSSILESLRFVLGAGFESEDVGEKSRSMLNAVLGAGGRIVARIRTFAPNEASYDIERARDDAMPRVLKDGEQIDVRFHRDVLPARIFGQHEIAALAFDTQKVTGLIDAFIDADPRAEEERQTVRRQLGRSRERILAHEHAIASLRNELDALPAHEERLAELDKAGVAKELSERGNLAREEKLLVGADERLVRLRDAVVAMRREVPVDLTFLSDRILDELPGRALIIEARELLTRLSDEVVTTSTALANAIEQAASELSMVSARFRERRESVQKAYEATLRDLQKHGLDAGLYGPTVDAVERLRPKRQQVGQLEAELEALRNERTALLERRDELDREQFEARIRAAKKIRRQAGDHWLDLDVRQYGDRQKLFDVLQEEVGGQLKPSFEALRKLPSLSARQVADACREGDDSLVRLGVQRAAARNIVARGEPLFRQLEELDLPTTTTLRFNVGTKDKPQLRPIGELSKGQSASAILLLLLVAPPDARGTPPLVIDQPEDDLDNRFVTEVLVPKLREAKKQRQIVLASHNANIPVVGDAELVLGLDTVWDEAAQPSRLRIVLSEARIGSLDDAGVQQVVTQTLEGGNEAFELRRAKYGY